MKGRLRSILCLLLVGVLMTVACACTQSAAPTQTAPEKKATGPKMGGHLRVALNNVGTGALVPWVMDHTKNTVFARMFSDSLVEFDANGKIVDALAESWSVNDKMTEYTFKLKQGVVFHDGTPCNADAVVFNINKAVELNSSMYVGVKLGGKNFKAIEKVDNLTVKFVFNNPRGDFYQQASTIFTHSPTAIQKYGKDYGFSAVVSTGPYKVVEWVEDNRIVMEKNPNYKWGSKGVWGEFGPGYVDKITILGPAEAATRMAAFEAGEVDYVMGEPNWVRQFEGRLGIVIERVSKVGSTRHFYLNTSKAPLDDIRVRMAVSHAIDRKMLVDGPKYQGVAGIAYAPVASASWPGGTEALKKTFESYNYMYDPERAKKLLDEAGWVMGSDGVRVKDGKKLILDCIVPSQFVVEVEPKQAMLAKVGIKLDIKSVADGAWRDARSSGNFHTSMNSTSSYGILFLRSFYHSTSTGNNQRYTNPQADALLDKLVGTPDPAKQLQYAEEAMKIILKDVSAVNTVDEYYVFFSRDFVKGASTVAYGWPNFNKTWLDK